MSQEFSKLFRRLVTSGGLGFLSNAVLRQGIKTTLARAYLKNITIETPGASEDITCFFTSVAITFSRVTAILNNGSGSPSVTYQLKHDPDRSAAGNNLTTSAAVTSVTTGTDATLDDSTVPKDSWIWIVTTAQNGTTPELAISFEYTEVN